MTAVQQSSGALVDQMEDEHMLAFESKHLENLASLQYCTVCIWHKQPTLRTTKQVGVGNVLTVLGGMMSTKHCPYNEMANYMQ